MPNIGTVFREEITRLSRRETRGQIDSIKKANSQHRGALALLKRQVAQLERQVRVLSRAAAKTAPAAPESAPGTRIRFVAKGLQSQRRRLGLSAGAFGTLVGVSAQSIYNWESGTTYPRGAQLARLAALRSIGKREAAQRLQQASAGKRPKKGK
ncbi:MAG: helix-turn-helix transcriptional regulator [Casimicrobiaceae bacterium]